MTKVMDDYMRWLAPWRFDGGGGGDLWEHFRVDGNDADNNDNTK